MDTATENMMEQVFKRRPVLAEILEAHAKRSLRDYVREFWEESAKIPDPLFVDVLKQQAAQIYNSKIAQDLAVQVNKKPLVSTIDHHGIWNHPIFVNSSLIYSLHFKPDQFALVLSTESVSLNNTSSWSGSLLYHLGLNLKRYSFFPDRLKTLPVFSTPSISDKDTQRLRHNSKGSLDELLKTLELTNAVPAGNFSRQAAILSSRLWEAVFPSAPKLLYVPLETLVLEYLLKVFGDPGDFLSQIILTGQGRDLWVKYFGKEHTFLFWGIDEAGRRKALTTLPENPEDIISLINSKKIYPSSPLCFAVLLKAGMACTGGFNQTTWLTNIKENLLKLLEELNCKTGIKNIPTKNFAESSLAWIKIADEYVNPTSLDLYFSGKDFYPLYNDLAQKLSLEQSLMLDMPTIYSVVVPKSEQISGFDLNKEQKLVFKEYKAIQRFFSNKV